MIKLSIRRELSQSETPESAEQSHSGCVRLTDNLNMIKESRRYAGTIHSGLVLPGVFKNFVPVNHYAAVINAQVRFLDLMNRFDDSRC